MALTAAQIKGRLKNLAIQTNSDPRILLRIYMMERFLERVSVSSYSNNFIVKGGILITSLIGISMRSTMDIDATIKNYTLSDDDISKMVSDISSINLNDGVSFSIKKISPIMSDMLYPGIRIILDALIEGVVSPIKIDFSSGDIITPNEISYNYPLLLEERSINLLSYNIETILAEKIHAILSKGELNTRMRDYYDVHVLHKLYYSHIDFSVFNVALKATCHKRNADNIINSSEKILETVSESNILQKQWISYQNKFEYAKEITFESAINTVRTLLKNKF